MDRVSVIIPTYNRAGQLKQVLEGLEKQDVPLDSFEVIVVSDGSTDGTDDYLHSLITPLRIRSIRQPNQGAATARNRGISQAGEEIILFLDDDVVPCPQLISAHLCFHELHGSTAVVLGPMLTPPGFRMSPWVQWEQAMLVKQYEDMIAKRWSPTARQFYTGNTSLARQHLTEAGGFDPSFRRAEDVELAYRLADRGLTFIFNPQAIGYHYAERSFASWVLTPYAYGVNDVIFSNQKGQQWLLPVIMSEYQGRHRFTKALTGACLDRKITSRATIRGLKTAALVGHLLGLSRLSQAACSGIFNLRHYQGIADQLGGRDVFFAGVKAAYVRSI